MASSAGNSIAKNRLIEERKAFRADHPFGFYARPMKDKNGGTDMFKWECGIPGKEDSPWAGGTYRLTMEFSDEYPSKPPQCKFEPKIFHPNIFPSGTVCLSILNEEKDYRPTVTVKQILVGIQDLLDNPNLHDPAQREAYALLKENPTGYNAKIKELAAAYARDVSVHMSTAS